MFSIIVFELVAGTVSPHSNFWNHNDLGALVAHYTNCIYCSWAILVRHLSFWQAGDIVRKLVGSGRPHAEVPEAIWNMAH